MLKIIVIKNKITGWQKGGGQIIENINWFILIMSIKITKDRKLNLMYSLYDADVFISPLVCIHTIFHYLLKIPDNDGTNTNILFRNFEFTLFKAGLSCELSE